jgi:hypothetical protein
MPISMPVKGGAMSVRVLAAGIHRHKERQPEPDLIANKPSVDVANRLYATVPQDRDHQFETGIRRPIRCIIRQSKLT